MYRANIYNSWAYEECTFQELLKMINRSIKLRKYDAYLYFARHGSRNAMQTKTSSTTALECRKEEVKLQQ